MFYPVYGLKGDYWGRIGHVEAANFIEAQTKVSAWKEKQKRISYNVCVHDVPKPAPSTEYGFPKRFSRTRKELFRI